MKQVATLFTLLLSAHVVGASQAPAVKITQTLDEDTQLITKEVPNAPTMSADTMYKILSAEMAISRDAPQVAMENYIAVAQETQDPVVAQRATQIALSMASLEKAVIPAKIWADNSPVDLEAQITMAAIVLRLKREAETVHYLERVVKIDPIDSDRHFVMLYKQLPEEVDRKQVLSALTKLSEKNKESNLALIALADISLYENLFKDSIAYSESALKINPKDPKGVILFAQAHIQNQDAQKALVFLEQKIKEIPDEIPLLEYYAQFLIDQNQLEKAHTLVIKIGKKPGLLPKQQLELARLCMQAGWLDEAEVFLSKVRVDPDLEQTANYFLARLYESKNEVAKSAEWYQKVTSGSFHMLSVVRASELLVLQKKYDDAMMLLSAAEPQTFIDYKRITLAKVQIFTDQKKYKEAYALLSEELQNQPDEIDFIYTRAIVSEKMNRIEKVEEDLKKVIELDPNNLEALNALGFILANRTTRYEDAMGYIQKAMVLSPDNPSVLDSLGWLQYKMGKKKEAIKTLKKALDLYPDAEIAAHLGEVLWSYNMQSEAKKIWQEALKSNPNDTHVRETMERLKTN